MRWRYLLAALLPAAWLVSGCVIGNGSLDLADQTPAQAINAQPPSALREGGNLRIALQGFPTNFNYLQVDGDDADTNSVIGPLVPSSYVSDSAGNVSVDHDYFTDARLINTTPQTVVFTINPKAVWSDGTPITWEDLASQANALSGRDTRYQIAATNGFDRVASVTRGVDDRQAIVTFSQPYGSWLGIFSPLYPKSITGTPDAFNTGDRDGMAISSGPFRIRSVDKVANRIVLERNPLWWGAKPKLDAITFAVFNTSAWVPALQNGEIDATEQNEALSALSQVRQVRNSADVDLRHYPEPSNMDLIFNGASGAMLHDAALRLAIGKAIDREGIVRAVQFGMSANPKVLNNHVYLLNQTGYQDNSAPMAYHPDAAARELDALGWRKHGDVRVKDGRRLEVRIVVTQDQARVEIAQILQQNLAAVGVKADIQTHPGTGFFSDMIIPGNFDIGIFGWVNSSFPLANLNQLYAYDPANPLGNYGRIGNAQINQLIDGTTSELDPNKAMAMANTLDRALFDEGYSLPLFQDPGNYPVRSNVANYGAFGLATIDYTRIGFMK